ncbi:hypothetical protein BASA62_010229 [Batrachochytrium salamandrivorans]|nr:hypothetical protein BASA62_010229 [Batrachochytrium salamandrivorans]
MLARMDASSGQQEKPIQIGYISRHPPFSVDHGILCDQQSTQTHPCSSRVECAQVTGPRILVGTSTSRSEYHDSDCWVAHSTRVGRMYRLAPAVDVLNGEADLDRVGCTGLWSRNLWGRSMILGALAAQVRLHFLHA